MDANSEEWIVQVEWVGFGEAAMAWDLVYNIYRALRMFSQVYILCYSKPVEKLCFSEGYRSCRVYHEGIFERSWVSFY